MVSNLYVNTPFTRDEKKEVLAHIILEAWTEQRTEARLATRIPGYAPFDVRKFRTERLDQLVDVLRNTDALELLAEMVGAIDEEA